MHIGYNISIVKDGLLWWFSVRGWTTAEMSGRWYRIINTDGGGWTHKRTLRIDMGTPQLLHNMFVFFTRLKRRTNGLSCLRRRRRRRRSHLSLSCACTTIIIIIIICRLASRDVLLLYIVLGRARLRLYSDGAVGVLKKFSLMNCLMCVCTPRHDRLIA